MKRLFCVALAALFAIASVAPTWASDRVVVYPAQTPTSTETNQQPRLDRNATGTMLRDIFGGLASGGVYAGLCVVPQTGMYVAAQPCANNTLGSLYQLGVSDAAAVPASGSPALAADPTTILIHALQSATSPAIGPFTAAPPGDTVYYLVESQVQTVDASPQALQFINASGQRYTQTVNTQRQDQIVYQIKAGTPAASPTVPAVDSGWIGVATVLVPNGVTQITSPMIAALPAFTGFLTQSGSVQINPVSAQPGSSNILGTSTAQRFVSTVATGTAPFTVNSTTVVPNLNAATAQSLSGILGTTQGGTGTATPLGVTPGSSGNFNCSGAFPNLTCDVATSPTFTTVSASTVVTPVANACIGADSTGTLSASTNCAAVFNVKGAPFHAVCDGVTDDSSAFQAAINAAAVAGGTVVVPPSATACRINSALTFPNSGAPNYLQNPIRITGLSGASWNGVTGTGNTSAALDLRYDGVDGLHPAKIDTRGGGYLEIDHLTIEDLGSDNFLFMQTTSSAVYAHDNRIIGNPANTGTANRQDFIRLGGVGLWASSANITSGSHTLTIGGGDPPFTSSMVGWTVNYSAAGAMDGAGGTTYGNTISAYVSPTQVTLTNAAPTTVTGGEANYFTTGGSDPNAAFQGYTSRLVHNLYSHIRRAVIFGNYSNGSVAQDELFDFTDGCSNADIPNCAPYYFDRASSERYGNIIRAPQGEITNYPYFVSVVEYAHGNVFEDLAPDDPSFTTVGTVYYGGDAVNNRTSLAMFLNIGTFPTINTTVAASTAAGSQTVTPASMTNITTSTKLLIDPDGSGVTEWVTPSATTGTTFTATFAYAHGPNIRILGDVSQASGPSWSQNTLIGSGNNPQGYILPNKGTLGAGYPYSNPTSILGPLILPNIGTGVHGSTVSDNGPISATVGTGSLFSFGTPGVSSGPLFAYGVGTATNIGEVGPIGGTLNGLTCDLWEEGQVGGGAYSCLDHSGNFAARSLSTAGTISANGGYVANPGEIGCYSAAGSGGCRYWFGTSPTTGGYLDFNRINAGGFTFVGLNGGDPNLYLSGSAGAFKTGTSSYGSSATVSGAVSATGAFNVPGTVFSTWGSNGGLTTGALGTGTVALTMGNASGTGATGATSITGGGDTIQGVQTKCFEVVQKSNNPLGGFDCSGNFATLGSIRAATSVTCSATSGVPCVFTWTGTMVAGAFTATKTVPANATCSIEPNVTPIISSTNMVGHWLTLSSTTLTINIHDMLSSATSVFSGTGSCV